MKRTLTLAAAFALLFSVVVSGGSAAQATSPTADPPLVFVTDFEDESTKLDWVAHSDATDARMFERSTGDNGCADGGKAFGALSSYDPAGADSVGRVSGAARPGPVATWAEGNFDTFHSLVDVKVQWSARSIKNCENCTWAVYVGNHPPSGGWEFDIATSVSRGWQQLSHEAQLNLSGGDSNGLYVALGWMGGNATIGLDCITVTVARTPVSGDDGSVPTPTPPAVTEDPAGGDFYYDFEDGLAPWGYDTDHGFGMLELDKGLNACTSVDGYLFASVKSADNGGSMVWPSFDPLDYEFPVPHDPALHMIAPFRAAAAEVSHIELDWMSKSVEQCVGCTQLVYVGHNEFPNATDFKRLGVIGEEWAATHFEMFLDAAPASKIFVALGWEEPGGERPQVPRDVGFDCVSVRIHQPDN